MGSSASTEKGAPTMQNTMPNETPKWPFVLFAILLIAALGGGYVLYQRAQTPLPTPAPINAVPAITTPPVSRPTSAPEEDGQTRGFMQQGTSDEVSALEADLQGTDLSKVDLELSQVDSETSGL